MPEPCAACRTLRRRCAPHCVFAPYFRGEDGMSRFAAVHGVFGASNVSKMLERVERPQDRGPAADTLVEEARARLRDPSFGCVAYLRILQEVYGNARRQVDDARQEIAREFGAEAAAAATVDVAAADPAARAEARAQVAAALKQAREQDDWMLGVRKANETRWRGQEQQHQHQAGTRKQKHGWKQGLHDVERHRGIAKDHRDTTNHQQMAGTPKRWIATAEASISEDTTMLMPQATRQLHHHHQQMSDAQQLTAAAEVAREEEARTSWQAPAAAWQQHQHLGSAGQHGDHEAESSYLLEVEGQRRRKQATETRQWDEEEIAKKMRMFTQQFAAAEQHHDPAPWLQPQPACQPQRQMDQQMAEAHQTADASQQAARDHYMEILLQSLAEAEVEAERLDAGKVASAQDMNTLHAHARAGEVLAEQEMMQFAAGAQHQPQQNHVAQAQHAQKEKLGIALGYEDLDGPTKDLVDKLAAMAEVAKKQQMAATARRARGQEMFTQQGAAAQQHPVAQYSETELDISRGQGHRYMHQPTMQQMFQEQQLADVVEFSREPNTTSIPMQQVAAAEVAPEMLSAGAREFDNLADDTGLTLGYGHPDMHQLVAAAGKVSDVQDMNTRHSDAALFSEQEMMQFAGEAQQQYLGYEDLNRPTQELLDELAAIAEVAKKQQQHPMAQYSETELDVSLGMGHPYSHQPTVQQMLNEQQLADVVEFTWQPNPDTNSMQDVAAYANGEHGSGAGATMSFLSPGSANASPFLVDQQPQPQVQAATMLGHQMGSSLAPMPASLAQLHAQASHQQGTDGGSQGLSSDLAAYLYY